MSTVMESPHVTEEGIAFSVAVGFMRRECLIPKQTLSHICRTRGDDMDCMAAFRAYEDKIIAVAQRMAVAGAGSAPIILERKFFSC